MELISSHEIEKEVNEDIKEDTYSTLHKVGARMESLILNKSC